MNKIIGTVLTSVGALAFAFGASFMATTAAQASTVGDTSSQILSVSGSAGIIGE